MCPNYLDDCKKNKKRCCVKIDIEKLNSKIWLTNSLGNQTGIPNFTALLSSKIYRSDIYFLSVFDPWLIFDDLKFLSSSSVTEIELWKTSFFYSDGKCVLFEAIFQAVPYLKRFRYTFDSDTSMITASTLKNIEKLPNFQNLESVKFFLIPEILAVEGFYKFIMKNENIKIYLEFDNSISDANKNQIDALIDEIIQANIPNRYIEYDGQDEEKYKILESRYIWDSDDEEIKENIYDEFFDYELD